MNTPDLAEPITGWRAWLVVDTLPALRLHSIARDVVWQPGQAVTARCQPHSRLIPVPRQRAHEVPEPACGCGVYGLRSPRQATNVIDPYARLGWRVRHRVVGRVSLWGRVVESQYGWRAEHAYPASLFVPTRRLHGAEIPGIEVIINALTAYGVPVQELDAGRRDEIARLLVAPPTY